MNYAVKKRVNSPPRAIDHPKDLKSVYTTSGKGARRSREYNCLVLSQCGSAFGVCELTHDIPSTCFMVAQLLMVVHPASAAALQRLGCVNTSMGFGRC